MRACSGSRVLGRIFLAHRSSILGLLLNRVALNAALNRRAERFHQRQIPSRGFLYLDISARQRVLILGKGFRHNQPSSPLHFVLVNNNDEKAAKKYQGNQVRPKVTVLDRLI
jgi:hypothetical protein